MTNETKTKAFKCLQALLQGEVLHRKKLGDKGVADNNDSLHSLTLRTQCCLKVRNP